VLSSIRLAHRFGNQLYKVAFPVYRPLYGAFKAYSDRAERRTLARILRPGSAVVDAGANIGIYSRFLAQCVGPTGLVHGFEPSPENFARLQSTTSKLPNVRINSLAVGDKTGDIQLHVADDLNVDHRVYQTAGESRGTILIRATTLDDYFEPGGAVDFIKMDIQGYELHALKGAKRVLTDNDRIQLLIEFWPYGLRQAGSSPEELLSFLRSLGFATYRLRDDSLSLCDNPETACSDPLGYCNLFVKRHDSEW